MTRRRKQLVAGLAALVVACLAGPLPGLVTRAERRTRLTTVLIIGGSAAYGWHDKTGEGYIVRGLKAWAANPARLRIENRAVPGATVHNPIIDSGYEGWLDTFSPQIVVIAWGLLNDLRVGIPWSVVLGQLRQWIVEALAARAVVFIVTPPATQATYTVDRSTEPAIAARELAMARGLKNPNVLIFNVLTKEEEWLAAHHMTYAPLMDGPWDPNTEGHIVAGRILTRLLKAKRPRGVVHFHTEGVFTPGAEYFQNVTRVPRRVPLKHGRRSAATRPATKDRPEIASAHRR